LAVLRRAESSADVIKYSANAKADSMGIKMLSERGFRPSLSNLFSLTDHFTGIGSAGLKSAIDLIKEEFVEFASKRVKTQ